MTSLPENTRIAHRTGVFEDECQDWKHGIDLSKEIVMRLIGQRHTTGLHITIIIIYCIIPLAERKQTLFSLLL